ncbi:MAG: hypothetical protein IIC91_03270 [Chloroflexi bacterium]|nr:hypothetical protein [Chloroflexota bacterium]
MRRLRAISEDEMIAVFLACEFGSFRFGDQLRQLLKRDAVEPAVIEAPTLASEQQNTYRRRLLGEVRGLGRDTALFHGFPDDVTWERCLLTPNEVSRIEYCNYSYWLELSNGTRKPAEGAARIKQGVKQIMRQSTKNFRRGAAALRAGTKFREMILATHDRTRLVVIEGHLRLTVYMMEPRLVPDELEVILGSSDRMTDWRLY